MREHAVTVGSGGRQSTSERAAEARDGAGCQLRYVSVTHHQTLLELRLDVRERGGPVLWDLLGGEWAARKQLRKTTATSERRSLASMMPVGGAQTRITRTGARARASAHTQHKHAHAHTYTRTRTRTPARTGTRTHTYTHTHTHRKPRRASRAHLAVDLGCLDRFDTSSHRSNGRRLVCRRLGLPHNVVRHGSSLTQSGTTSTHALPTVRT
jgi:hypothetical protein